MNKTPFSQMRNKRVVANNFENQDTGGNMTSQDDTIVESEYERLRELNCSSNFLEPTLNRIPSSANLLAETHLPLAITVNPLNHLEPTVPVSDFSVYELPRCVSRSCRAYVNCFVKWIDNGANWICNLCNKVNKTKDHYYCRTKKNTNIREDTDKRPELRGGSVDFIAGSAYSSKPPMEPTYVFLLDTSYSAIEHNYLAAAIETLKELVDSESFFPRAKVCFIGYSDKITFYSINPKKGVPQVHEISPDALFVPAPLSNLIVSPIEGKDNIMRLLEHIVESSQELANYCRDSNLLLTAVQAANMLVKDKGAKLFLINASMGHTTNGMFYSPDSKSNNLETAMLSPTDKNQMFALARNMVQNHSSIDVFTACEKQTNIQTLNQLPKYTGGNLYCFKHFRAEVHYKNLFSQLKKAICREVAWESMMRTRFSKGIKVESFVSPCLIVSEDLMNLPQLDSEQSFTLSLKIGQTEDEGMPDPNENFAYFQTAVLYSHSDGSRRIRVHNYCIPFSPVHSKIFDNVNGDALAAFYAKRAVHSMYSNKVIEPSVLREENAFRKMVKSCLSVTRKELPDSLAYLPVNVLGMNKNRLFCGAIDILRKTDSDLTNYLRFKLQKQSTLEAIPVIQPRIYNLNNLLMNDVVGTKEEEMVEMPEIVNNSEISLEEGIFLVDNGFLLILYVRNECDSELRDGLIGEFKDSSQFTEEDFFADLTDLKERVLNIVEFIRNSKAIYQNMLFVFEGEKNEKIIQEALIEDNYCSWYQKDYESFYKMLMR